MIKFYQKKEFLNDFVKLIKICNKVILDIYKQDFEINFKNDNSPITAADLKSNEIIVDYLNILNKKLTNETKDSFCIISEESKNMNYVERKNYNYTWLVDPIDGTKEFLKKNGEFTVNIGLCYLGVPIFGIVSIPVKDEIYYGTEGLGSYKIDKDNQITELKIKEKDFNKENLNIIASKSHLNNETLDYIKQFKNYNLLNVGSSIKLLYVAEGIADIYPRYAPTSEWDTCASHAVVKYAGGKVINTNNKEELIYNKENILNPYFLVY